MNLIAGGTTGGLKVRNAKREAGPPVVRAVPNRERDWRDALAAREAMGGHCCSKAHAHEH